MKIQKKSNIGKNVHRFLFCLIAFTGMCTYACLAANSLMVEPQTGPLRTIVSLIGNFFATELIRIFGVKFSCFVAAILYLMGTCSLVLSFVKIDEKCADMEDCETNSGADTVLNKEDKHNLMWHLKNLFVLEDEE